MRRTRWILGLSTVGGFSAFIVLLVLARSPDRITEANWKTLAGCHSRQEVIEILGEPQFGPGELQSDFVGGTLSSMMMRQEGEAWKGRDVTIRVRFVEGVVSGTMITYHQDETLLARVGRWLRSNVPLPPGW